MYININSKSANTLIELKRMLWEKQEVGQIHLITVKFKKYRHIIQPLTSHSN